jgi:hypothetical protein
MWMRMLLMLLMLLAIRPMLPCMLIPDCMLPFLFLFIRQRAGVHVPPGCITVLYTIPVAVE